MDQGSTLDLEQDFVLIFLSMRHDRTIHEQLTTINLSFGTAVNELEVFRTRIRKSE